jgi:putative FmdB family regulatory protein
MPVYEYQAAEGGCDHCRDGFDTLQSVSAEPLTECPECGGAIRRLLSRVNYSRNIMSRSNLKDKGFTKLVRRDSGVYEKE